MYYVFFEIFRGHTNTPTEYPAGSSESYEEACEIARKCYGVVRKVYNGANLADYRIK